MRLYITSRIKAMKPKDRSWCPDAVRSKEEAFIQWKSNPTPDNELLRKQARNGGNVILKHNSFYTNKSCGANFLILARAARTGLS